MQGANVPSNFWIQSLTDGGTESTPRPVGIAHQSHEAFSQRLTHSRQRSRQNSSIDYVAVTGDTPAKTILGHVEDISDMVQYRSTGQHFTHPSVVQSSAQYYEEVWSTGAVEVLDGIMAEAHEQHDKILQPGKFSVGRSSMAKGIVGYRRAYPDLV